MRTRILTFVMTAGIAAAVASGPGQGRLSTRRESSVRAKTGPAEEIFGSGRFSPGLEAALAAARPDETIDIIVHTRRQADLSDLPPGTSYDGKVSHLQSVAELAQRDLLRWLETTDAGNVRSFWLVSRVALSATPDIVRALAARDDVAYLFDDFTVTIDPRTSAAEPDFPTDMQQWNISRVRAPECWAAGFNGAGIVVGNIDTGVQVTHTVFGGRWRSSNGWFDGVNGQTNPYDDNGHGTHCMGTAVGGNGYGVAPGATFIAAKGLNSHGSGQGSWMTACLDWMAGTGRPDVISISWGSDRNETYWFHPFNNLRSLGTVVVGAIGNEGSSGSTSLPPGSYPIVIGVGATTNTDAVAWFSSRGPAPNSNPWNDPGWWPRSDWNLINPGISAPGVSIRSAVPGGYYTLDGTSMAAPHAAGAAAILLQKQADLTHDEIFNLLADHADRPSGGAPYPNNRYGWGRLNVKTALDNVGGGGGGEEDTLRVHYVYDDNAVGLEDGGTFYSAARLTPTQGDCDVIAGIFLQHQASQNQHFFVWRGNTATNPGAVVESIPYTGAGTGWKRVELAQPFRVNANEDFWLGPRFQHAAGQFPGGIDVGPPVAQRGGWVSMDGTEWEELKDYGLNYNWMFAAIVRYGAGAEEELLLPAVDGPRLSAPTFARGSGRIGYTVPVSGRVELGVYDVGGRLVRTLVRGTVAAGEHYATWDRTDDSGRAVASGTYLYRLAADGRTVAAKSVVLD